MALSVQLQIDHSYCSREAAQLHCQVLHYQYTVWSWKKNINIFANLMVWNTNPSWKSITHQKQFSALHLFSKQIDKQLLGMPFLNNVCRSNFCFVLHTLTNQFSNISCTILNTCHLECVALLQLFSWSHSALIFVNLQSYKRTSPKPLTNA